MSILTSSSLIRSLVSGLAGAIALNVLHETVRQFVPEAPRADILGMRSIKKGYEKAGEQPPTGDNLYGLAMLGDVTSNAVYYSLVGIGPKQPLLVGAGLGVLAGVGAVTLPGPMGLGEAPTTRSSATIAMTVAWYLFGGVVAGGVYERLK
ncbi:hypothetical protein [Spirosoma utsteinense]|uniref:DUF1440 domain-containing protein n=1 Tax=Spirosoma utsteinense TaxID=2585773 RepID=A0ABR6W6Y9_9BACT|nr:hypothetical protein [Spirosoma utsteinense]MBC3785606.1 hypothetical protein [Spirosoma utsteinense]MBC3791756.1 hypothetical protein [Spirosoma utsteinense]